MVNTDRLHQAVQNFQFYSKPTSGNSSDPCTVGDINKVVDNLSTLLNTFIEELEKK